MIDIDELERLAKAATPGPWTTNLVRKRDVVEATKEEPAIVVSNFIEDAAFIAAVNPAVVLELIARLRAAEAAANDPELRRWAVNHIKTRFAQWRTPPVETPADSWIDEVVGEILRRATEYVK